MLSQNNCFGDGQEFPELQEKELDEDEMGPWEHHNYPQYYTLQNRLSNHIGGHRKKRKLQNQSYYKIDINQRQKEIKLPYLKNYSQKLQNLYFIRSKKELLGKDNLNFIRRSHKIRDKSEPTRRQRSDKSYLLRSEASPLKISKQGNIGRYDIYECMFQLKKGTIRERLKND